MNIKLWRHLMTLLCGVILLCIGTSAFAQNNPPVVDAGPDQTILLGDYVPLYGTATDVDGQAIAAWLWSVESAPAGSNPRILYPDMPDPLFTTDTGGDYVLSLVATDGIEWSEPDSVSIHVHEVLPPEVVIAADVISGPAPLTVQFDGSGTTVDPYAGELTYTWDFGDGEYSAEIAPTHTFQRAGDYTVVLSVVDGRLQSDSDYIEITVTASDNPPSINPTATPDSGNLPLEVEFRSNATDPDGDPLSFLWDFGDPDSADNTSTLSDPSHVYQEPGTYTVSLAVSDGQHEVSASLTVEAGTLRVSEYRITASTAYETTPTIGNDGTTNLVVYTQRQVISGVPGPADIWYQPLKPDGSPTGLLPVQVTSGVLDEELNDVSGDYIVYTAYESVSSVTGSIILYQISTGQKHTLGSATIIQEPRIHGSTVVWREGGAFSAMVMRYKLAWLGTELEADILAGPIPPTYEIQIGERYVVWSELDGGQYDILAYDLDDEIERRITSSASIDERAPATSGAWIVWQQTEHGATYASIQAHNQDTHESLTIADADAGNFNPSIDGDLITWGSDVTGNLDIWVYRLSTNEHFQVTTDINDQYLNDVFGNMVAYVDMRRGQEDVYLSYLEFILDNQPPLADAGVDQTAHVGVPVTLDGSGSSDPDGDYPLSFQWELWYEDVPASHLLSDATIVNPTFTPEQLGNYTAYLTVTDSRGAVSDVDITHISSTNTAPIADAGQDQSISVIGTTVSLDGTQSWDPDGDAITYAWTLQRPAGSLAGLDDPISPTPSFIADVNGDYTATLVVSDGHADSEPDSVLITFQNVPPVADAGDNQAVVVGDSVNLNGTDSYDANGDALTYQWSFVSTPSGNTASFDDATSPTPSFIADLAGTYVVSLVVNDGLVDSEPSNVTITAISTQDEVTARIDDTINAINTLDTTVFKNRNLQNALTNKLSAVLTLIDQGQYQQAFDKLVHDILPKTNGCAESGAPDKNDWITTCESQEEVYPLIVDTIELLEQILGG